MSSLLKKFSDENINMDNVLEMYEERSTLSMRWSLRGYELVEIPTVNIHVP